ncbi:uncharacterized protein [Temnothorax longispinosus]|uniref:uncharacterized protein n=1 Tax=Temnothorax longispinosus TaxID=300112 RepID=UPI003A9A5AA1
MNTWFKQHPRRLYTWMSPGGAYRNQIDYVLIDTRWRSSITNAKTLPGADCESDHQLLVAEFKARLKVVHKVSNNKALHMHADAISRFRQDMHTRLLGMETDSTESANDMWVRLKTAVIDSAETIVQQRRGPRSRPDWMSQETWSAVLRRRTLKENGLSTEDDRRHYRELHRTVQRLCRKDKDAEVDRVCQEIEESSNRAHTKDMFCKVKSLTKDIKIKSWTLEDDTGAIITDRYKVLERWREYCRGLYAATEDSEELRMSECGVREPDILLAEIEWAMARLKHKTSGGDRVTVQMLKNLGPEGTHMLHLICQRVWSTGRWPDDWSESILVPLHKKGSTRKCENYRTI